MAAAAFTLALAACAHAPAQPLRIAAHPEVFEAGPLYYAAAELGPARATAGPGGVPNLFADTADGVHADVAGNAETQALRISVAHPDLRIVMTVTEGLYRIVARRSAGIATLGDLKGKRVAVFANTSSAYFLRRMLASVGLSEADVTLVDLRPRQMAAALGEGRVDAVAIWEPESERAYAALGEDAIAFHDDGAYRELYNLNTTAEALADPARRAQIVAFVAALIEASRVAEQSPEPIWPLVAARSGYDVATVAAAWPHHRFPATLVPDLLDVLVDEEQWLAAQAGRPARSRAELALLIDPSVLEEARGR